MRGRDLDEDDVRIRPGKGSRPRTRQRPAHDSAVEAMVIAVDRGRYTCRIDDGSIVTAIRGTDVRRGGVVVGDRVRISGDVTGDDGSLGRIVGVQRRTSILRRTDEDNDDIERPVVANAELLIIVTAIADPEPRLGLIDRCLVAAYDGGLEPVLCLTKVDLGSPDALREAYEPLGVRVVTTSQRDEVVDSGELEAVLVGRSSVMFGHSGVGKSTLVNHLVPGAKRATGTVSGLTGKGRHTSSSAVALELPGGGWVIDTPGVRALGLGAVQTARVIAAFPDLAEATELCLPGCSHTADQRDCHLDVAAADGTSSPVRVASLRRLLASMAAN